MGILFLVLIILVSLMYFLGKYTYEHFYKRNTFDKIIAETAKRHCIDPCLLKAVIWRESRFNPNARGSKGEIGLMQLMRTQSVKDWADANNTEVPCEGALFFPRLNIEIGAWYLAKALKKNDKYKYCDELALAEYNAGAQRLKQWRPADYDGEVIQNIDIGSTKKYVMAIMNKYIEYSMERTAK